MLAIRLQRLGRKGYPVYRVAVQEAQRHPSSGRVIAYVGSYNPHTKDVKFDVEKVTKYLKNGAQPSPRVIKLLVDQKVKLPEWVQKAEKKQSKLRNPDKLRRNQPKEEAKEEPAVETPAETPEEVEEILEETAPAPKEKEADTKNS